MEKLIKMDGKMDGKMGKKLVENWCEIGQKWSKIDQKLVENKSKMNKKWMEKLIKNQSKID